MQRRAQIHAYDVWTWARPAIAPPYFVDLQVDVTSLPDASANYGVPITLGGNLANGKGAFENGRVQLINGSFWSVVASGKRSLLLDPSEAFFVPFQALVNGVWQSNIAWKFSKMEVQANNVVLLTLTAPLAAPITQNPGATKLRVGFEPYGWYEGDLTGSTVGTVTVGPVGGSSFRFPCRVFDDTVYARQQAGRGVRPSPFITTNGANGCNLVNRFLADVCIRVVALAAPYGDQNYVFTHRLPIFDGNNMSVAMLQVALLSKSRLLHEYKLSNKHAWTMAAHVIPGGVALWKTTWDNFGDHDPNAETQGLGGLAFDRAPIKYSPDPPVPGGGHFFPHIALMPFSFLDTDTAWEVGGHMALAYQLDGSVTNGLYQDAAVAVHEILHHFAVEDMPVNGTWSIYAPIVDPSDEHSIPGLIANDVWLDPVIGQNVNPGNAYWPNGNAETRLSPYMIRLIKELLVAPSRLKRQ